MIIQVIYVINYDDTRSVTFLNDDMTMATYEVDCWWLDENLDTLLSNMFYGRLDLLNERVWQPLSVSKRLTEPDFIEVGLVYTWTRKEVQPKQLDFLEEIS
jgi:hypothetical protein